MPAVKLCGSLWADCAASLATTVTSSDDHRTLEEVPGVDASSRMTCSVWSSTTVGAPVLLPDGFMFQSYTYAAPVSRTTVRNRGSRLNIVFIAGLPVHLAGVHAIPQRL